MTDVPTAREALPREAVTDGKGQLSRSWRNYFEAGSRRIGEIISGVNLNRQSIVDLGTEIDDVSAAYIAADAVVAADAASANATLLTTLRAQLGGDGSPIPDWGYRDADFWNLPSGATFAEGSPFTSPIRSIVLSDGTYDFSSDYWRVEPGATYEITFRWWNGFPGFTGFVRPMLHIPSVMWQALRGNGAAISNPDSATGDQTGDIITGSSSNTEVYRYTMGSTTTQIQMRLKADFGGSVNFYFAVEMKRLPQFAEVTNIAEAYATDNGSTARLVWTVDTGTNVATIEQTAASGYDDGTWNGSAISLTADEISLRADALNLGSATTFEATHDTFYTVAGSYRFRYGGPFGTSSDLLQWYGLNSVALNSETKTNGIFALATDGKVYYGAGELVTGSGLNASSSPASNDNDRAGAGSLTVSGYTISVSGNTGALTYTYVPSVDVTVGGTNTAPTFTRSVGVGERFEEFITLQVYDAGSGRTANLVLRARFREVTSDPW